MGQLALGLLRQLVRADLLGLLEQRLVIEVAEQLGVAEGLSR